MREERPWTLGVELRLDRSGPRLLREAVTEADLLDPLSECWLECLLRRGFADVALDALRPRVVPLFSESGATCVGYALEIRSPDGKPRRRDFTIHSLEAVAERGARRLVARGDMRDGDAYYFQVVPEQVPAASDAATADATPGIAGEARTRQVDSIEVPLASLLERARTVGPQDADAFRVLYTEHALARAETLARKGGDSEPPVETGGVLIGTLARCPETHDLFVVVVDVLEAADAEEQPFSLAYSGRTWGRIQTVMKAMRSQPATRTHRIVGQCHGHNFLPGGGAPPCEACPHLSVCGRSSVFVSRDDATWARAVFHHQPWHLSHIFGLNARQEKIHGLFGLRDGRLLVRGFHVIDGFEGQGESQECPRRTPSS